VQRESPMAWEYHFFEEHAYVHGFGKDGIILEEAMLLDLLLAGCSKRKKLRPCLILLTP
jgi:hypothetical protein